MPRKKEFDVDEVLDKAMMAFWKRGYEATSLNDLLDHMQIQRASLYNAFRDKRSLFLNTLERYDTIHRRPEVAKRLKMPSPRQAILGLFQNTIAGVMKHRSRNGCFLINTALELAPHDKEVAKFVRRCFVHMERQFFKKRIEQGIVIGEISKSVVPAQAASAILSLYMGLQVLSRSRPEKRLLEAIAKQAELLLTPGDQSTLDLAVAHHG